MFYFGVFFLILQSTLSNGDNAIACENEYLNIKCPSDDTIIIKSANYGRTDSLVCPDDDAFFNKNNRCISPDALAIVGKKCDGHSSCSINATNDIFGNPCNNTTKYLSVDYGCKNVSCPENEKYSPCASCQKTCETLENNTLCKCSSGCACKEGLVRSKNDGKCVSINTCTGYNGTANERIYGGTKTDISHFPYQISLQKGWIIGKLGIALNHVCGGSILNSKWVLTAGHCFTAVKRWPLQHFWVAAGITNLKDSRKKGQYIRVKKWHVHPKYAGGATVGPNDIAVLELKHKLSFNKLVQPVKLPEKLQNFQGISTVSGWGRTRGFIFPKYPKELQTTQYPLMSIGDCKWAVLKKMYFLKQLVDSNSNICTGPTTGKSSVCNGDSGGPLVYYKGTTPVLIGIVSWAAANCHTKGLPSGVYTKVSSFTDFIDGYIY